jgi:hypothetical protein
VKTQHGHSINLNSKWGRTPTYNSWRGMKYRCTLPSQTDNYKNYGALGVRFCDRWNVFANFLEDMGVRPEGMTLDRIDPTGNYEPSNCRWADAKTQAANKRKKVSA